MAVEVLEKEEVIEEKESVNDVDVSSLFDSLKINDDSNVLVLIVETKYSNHIVCGKKNIDYVKIAANGYDTQIVEDNGFTALQLAKFYINKDYDYMVVLYGDTPLLRNGTLKDILDFVKMKQLDIMQLLRGWVFATGYLSRVNKLLSPQFYDFGREDFLSYTKIENASLISSIMQKRINSYFLENGVEFANINTAFLDADVEIENNVKLGHNVIIKGNSIVKSGAKIEDNTIIENSIIFEDAKICQSVIKNSVVEKNVKINPFCVITNKALIKENDEVESFTKINGED